MAARMSYFIREQDIQLYLADYLRQTGAFANIFLEYHVSRTLIPPFLWGDAIYIDIVVEVNNQFFPIEIKYKTMGQTIPHTVFGLGVPVVLGQHGAQNIGKYDFWKDVKRIEFFQNQFATVNQGFVLFVTNDGSYMNPPGNNNVGFAPFSMHQGRMLIAGQLLNWNGNLAVANGRPGFTLNNGYNINWMQLNYDPQHYYVLV